jgi:osmotically-inducible protein OsmY
MTMQLMRVALATAASAALTAALCGCVPVMIAGGVAAGAVVATDRRTTGAQVDDEVIEDKTVLTLHQRFKGDFHVNVTSYNGIVLLTGEVPAEPAKADVEQIVRSTPKVRAVQDELVVGPVTDLSSRSNDTVNKFQITHVKVVTERGVVYLMGIVRRDEGDAAGEIASTTSGVQRVVKVFEYTGG